MVDSRELKLRRVIGYNGTSFAPGFHLMSTIEWPSWRL